MKVKFGCSEFNEKPMFDMLLDIDNKLIENSLLKLKKRKNIVTINKK